MKRIVFMGTSGFGIPTLQALHEHHEVAGVVTRCDSCKGRGRKLQPSAVKQSALDLGLDVIEAENLTDPGFIGRLKEVNADIFFVAAFRILPAEVFTIPPGGTVNLHASLLPDYRGAAPINRAVINGDTGTGLTTFFIEETVDTGDIILTETIAIDPDETAGELASRMKVIGAGLSLKTVEFIERGSTPGHKQPAQGNRPAPRLFKKDGLIDWTRDSRNIHNQVRGMNPTPGAYTEWTKGPLKIHRTAIVDDTTQGSPGSILDASPREGPVVSCGTGSLRILELQPPGKKIMDGGSFVRGYRIETGTNISKW